MVVSVPSPVPLSHGSDLITLSNPDPFPHCREYIMSAFDCLLSQPAAAALRPKLVAACDGNSVSDLEALLAEAKQKCPGLLSEEASAATKRITALKVGFCVCVVL